MTDPIKNPAKKAKRSPIQSIKIGETMIDIKLMFITADAVRTLANKATVWTVIGTDGYDFINISFWEKNFNRLFREINNDYEKKTFVLKTFAAKQIPATFNYGSVDFELRAQESSTVGLISDSGKKILDINEQNYFEFLKQKFIIDEDFHPIPIEKARIGDKFVDIEPELCSINNIRKVAVQGNEARVLDVSVLAKKTRARLTAWNILADFLAVLLCGKEGCVLKLQGTQVKEGTGRNEIAFIFNNTSKITIEEKMLLEESILSLNDMAKKIGLIKCAVRVSIARKPSAMNLAKKQDGTICTDGQHKAQFIFPNNIKFKIGDELTVHTANVETNDAGVLTLTIYDEGAFTKQNDKSIFYELAEIDYPD